MTTMSLLQCVALSLLIGSVCCNPIQVFSEPGIYDEGELMGALEGYEPEMSNMVEEAEDYEDVPDDDMPSLSDIEEAENADLDQINPTITYGDIAVNPRTRNAHPCTARGCKWPKHSNGLVYVPVEISSRYNEAEKSVILNGLASFYRTTCIRFVWRKTSQDYLSFIPKDGCWSYLGRQGGKQEVSLQRSGCIYHQTVQHEVLHALGFHHEQVRSDRDKHVTILTKNIIPGKERNFEKTATNNLRTPYDYNSVMHYGRFAFSTERGKLPTIVPKPNPNVRIGLATQMSSNDILRVNRLYNC
ncbi:hatching enzyme 1.2-like [Astyanax mexicanus]|uniref:hatching enzyme 1.2-like n=1 Tax=Astyanax mexicanus TaxID=7994 RepID=UPI0020CB280B|nr:hatching enzyme 1.2-like [Astyanax mexicanus]